jgi:ParB/RepB/Spo0J family partition protein
VDLEHHQLDTRYEGLHVRRPEKERKLIASLASHGQQVPIVVVYGSVEGRYVVIDGHKRIRALKHLNVDVLKATLWQMDEASAVMLARSLRNAESESALEQGWLLTEMQSSFGWDQEELAHRFERSPSWVSRRLALVTDLPASVQEEVRQGRIGAHAAMKHLVPMARAKKDHCERLAKAIAPLGLSTRQVGDLYVAWRESGPAIRERILNEPKLFLKAKQESNEDQPLPSAAVLLRDLDVAGVLIRRVLRRLEKCHLDRDEVEQLGTCLAQTIRDAQQLQRKIGKEERNADARSASSDPGAAREGIWFPPDSENLKDRPRVGAEGDPHEIGHPTDNRSAGEGGAVSAGNSRNVFPVQGESAESSRGTIETGCQSVIPSVDRFLPPQWDWHQGAETLWRVLLQAGGGDSARYFTAPSDSCRPEADSADRFRSTLLLAYAIHAMLSDFQPFHLQGLPDRSPALL